MFKGDMISRGKTWKGLAGESAILQMIQCRESICTCQSKNNYNNSTNMRRMLISMIALMFAAFTANGQYLPEQETVQVQDITMTRPYKNAKAAFIGGLVVAGIGDLAVGAGSVVCIVEQNLYLNRMPLLGLSRRFTD